MSVTQWSLAVPRDEFEARAERLREYAADAVLLGGVGRLQRESRVVVRVLPCDEQARPEDPVLLQFPNHTHG